MLSEIEKLLEERLQPQALEITDESNLHEGHEGQRQANGGVSHIHIRIEAEGLRGLSRLQRHQEVMGVLAPFMERGLHSVRLTIN